MQITKPFPRRGEHKRACARRRGAWAAVWLACLMSATVSAQELTRDATHLTFANSVITLRFDAATGNLIEAGPVGGAPVVHGAAAEIRFADGGWLQQADYELVDAKLEPGLEAAMPPPWIVGDPAAKPTGTALALTMETTNWRRVERWRMWADEPFVARTITWTWRGAEPLRIDLTRLALTGLALPDSELVLPADFPVSRGPMRDTGIPRGSQNNQLAVLENQDHAVLALAAGVGEPVGGYLKDGAVVHQFGTQLIAQPNQPFEIGAQVLALSGSGSAAVAKVTHRVHDRFGLRVPTDTPGVDATVLYSAHPGGTIGSGFRDTGGFVQMAKRLPHLKALGFNCLWLLPFWKGPVYAPSDYYALDPRLGTEADLKALCDQAHQLGMKVLGDLIPHGPRDFTDLMVQHPDVATYNLDGSLKMMWGCLQCDYAQPAWQQYMADHAVYWMKKVGLDGYRVDVAFGGPPNWRPAPGLRPSMSQAYGARKLLARVRMVMKAFDPDSLLLMEGTAPGLCESGDIVYDFPWTYSVLPRAIDLPGDQWVPAAKEWLDWQSALYPRGARFLHYATSHDTIRGQWRYGPALHRALLAINACLPGVPMVYDDEEVGQTALGLWAQRDPATVTLASAERDQWAFGPAGGAPTLTCALNSLAVRRAAAPPHGDDPQDRPQVAGQNPTLVQFQESYRFSAPTYEVVFDGKHGGRVLAFSRPRRGAVLAGPETLREGRRKLRIGAPPADLLDWAAKPEVAQPPGKFIVTFRSPDLAGLRVVRRYDCRPLELVVETELTFAAGLDSVNASLFTTLPIALPHWRVPTLEGVLEGDQADLRPKPTTGEGFRYRHPTAPAWSHRQFPLVGALSFWDGQPDQPRWTRLSLADLGADQPGWLQDISLDVDGLRVGWLTERAKVTLAPNQTVTLRYRLEPFADLAPAAANGPLHVTQNERYRLAYDRSSGGTITELRRQTADGWGANLIDGLVTYSDHGIYGPYGDPAGVEHPTNAKSDYDIEPDVTLSEEGGRKSTLIEGTFRTPYADGRSIARPYTFYRHGFTTDDSGFDLRLGLRIPGGFESGDTPIFAAHILRLRDVRQVTIVAGGQKVVHDAAAADASRVWQSRVAGALPDSITVQAAGGTLVITPLGGGETLQNVFLYDSGGGRMTLFFAPFDMQPEQALPVWKESRWRLDLRP